MEQDIRFFATYDFVVAPISLLLTGIPFHLCELLWSARKIDRRARLRRDIMAASLALFFGGVVNFTFDVILALYGWQPRLDGDMSALGWVTTLVLAVIVMDFGQYWVHRLMHWDPVWQVHRWHHKPEQLYWFSAIRGSPGHIALMQLPFYSALAILSPSMSIIAAVGLIGLFNQHSVHMNVHLSDRVSRLLELLIVTPRYHQVHHSSLRQFADRNLGFIFSVWDRVFGTYLDPGTAEKDFRFGLTDREDLRMILGLPAANASPTSDTRAASA